MEAKDIIKKYIAYVQDKGKRPENEYVFAKHLKMSEAKFYTYFASLHSLEQEIWQSTVTSTIERLDLDQNYSGYSAREKLLAFYYTYVEELNESRSFYRSMMHFDMDNMKIMPKQLKSIRQAYLDYANTILIEATINGEIKARPFISKKYADLLFLQFLFVLKYWKNDDSKGFEKTDAAIEKAVNLSFDVLSSNIIDSMFDFAKFLIK